MACKSPASVWCVAYAFIELTANMRWLTARFAI